MCFDKTMKPAPRSQAATEIHIRLFGSFRAVRDGASISELESGRTRTLLAYLLLHRAAPAARPQLAYTLWPDTSDKQAQTNPRTLLFRLRRGLVDGDRFLAVTRGTVQLRTDAPLDMDLFEFERLLATADDARTDNERAQNLAQAVAIYRGDLLPDCYDDWIAPERERLRDLYLHALERLIGHHEEQRHYEAAIGQAQRLLRSDPLHEATYHRLMRLYALNGDRAGALRVYHACVDTLQRELDVEPGVKIEEAYQRLLHRKTTVTTKPETRRTRAQLVGRNSEWTALIEAWRRARAGRLGWNSALPTKVQPRICNPCPPKWPRSCSSDWPNSRHLHSNWSSLPRSLGVRSPLIFWPRSVNKMKTRWWTPLTRPGDGASFGKTGSMPTTSATINCELRRTLC